MSFEKKIGMNLYDGMGLLGSYRREAKPRNN
jgi:hypothetical protein